MMEFFVEVNTGKYRACSLLIDKFIFILGFGRAQEAGNSLRAFLNVVRIVNIDMSRRMQKKS